jgi:Domain of unknown function (DUF4440)
MNDEVAELEDFGKRWVEAELGRDVIVLDALTHKDFILVGPLGFALDKAQWLDRYANEDLVTSSLSWRDTQARVFGDCAVVIGTHDQQASYRGQPNNGQFRATQQRAVPGNPHPGARGRRVAAGWHAPQPDVGAARGTTADRMIITPPGEYAASRPR